MTRAVRSDASQGAAVTIVIMFLRKGDHEAGGGVEEVVDEETDSSEREDEVILCAACDHEITSHRHKTAIDGGFEHSFVNPAGIMYQIGCFEQASGVTELGEESDEFSWFPGYTWQVVVCRECTTHLGWAYWSGDHSFYGLILPRLQNV